MFKSKIIDLEPNQIRWRLKKVSKALNNDNNKSGKSRKDI